MSVKIYTKKGDKGMTSLYDGTMLRKSNVYFDVLGNIDELSTSIGLCESDSKDLLEYIQCRLMDISSFIATPHWTSKASDEKLERVKFNFDEETKKLEDEIDKYDKLMPSLKNFIIPRSVSRLSVQLHYARTVCRRAERSLDGLHDFLVSRDINSDLEGPLKYLNRLSDYLFQYARYTNFVACGEDRIWKKSESN